MGEGLKSGVEGREDGEVGWLLVVFVIGGWREDGGEVRVVAEEGGENVDAAGEGEGVQEGGGVGACVGVCGILVVGGDDGHDRSLDVVVG